MNYLDAIDFPASTDITTRIEWAGERYADLCEGKIAPEMGAFIQTYIVGWGDLCSEDDRRQYYAMARQFSELLQSFNDV
jgi:hypothetical protein